MNDFALKMPVRKQGLYTIYKIDDLLMNENYDNKLTY